MTRSIALARAGLLLSLVLFAIIAWARQLAESEDRLLDRAEFVVSDAATPPTQGWEPVLLPDNWRLTRPQLSGMAWYRVRFDLSPVPSQPQALYLPRLSLIGELRLNGSVLTPDVRFDETGRQGVPMDNAPVYVVLPSGLFRNGENLLEVRLQGDRQIRSGLSAIRLGPAVTLQPLWFERQLLQVYLPYVLLVLTSGALCFVYAYTLRQRRFSTIQLALLVGIVTLMLYSVLKLPISRGHEQGVRALATTGMYWLLCVSGHRLSGIRVPGMPAVIHGMAAFTFIAIAVAMIRADVTDRIWLLAWPLVFLQMSVIAALLLSAWRRRSVKLLLLALSAAFWTTTVAQSLAILSEWLPWDSFRWSVSGALPFCIVLLFFFAERFILDREEAAREQRAAIASERGRILQDMHDGIGAQLITAKRLARRPDVDRDDLASMIEESLQDLRLIIDSLDLTERDLLPLLGNLRLRLQPRLATLGIRLEWDVQPLPALTGLGPESALAILRIVQEAINNAVRHASPSCIRITVRADRQQAVIRISDDGRGFDAATIGPGRRGLTGMHLRAKKIGARLNVEGRSDSSTGAQVTLAIPHQLRDGGP
ncbi:sensor histidine kinase [Steroidobacter cummioxidans]|uniref:sensor histidine kinase n=1 Tax=Steroidobacter cummioxidans TaxID=1803913 RepID=UPI000E318781|nr:ATP-binding protein [Steroidobacter cummioxidans]